MQAAPSFAQGLPLAQPLVQVLDDPAEWPVFSRPCALAGEDACWESQLVIEGMHCAACALSIEQALQSVAGVVRAEVHAATQRARVVWRADRVRPSAWLAAVQAAGYRALPAGDAFARERRRREQQLALWRWLVAGFCMMQVMMYAAPAYVAEPGEITADAAQLLRWASWVLTLPVLFFSCGPFFRQAWRDVLQRRISMDLPVALGMAITFAVSTAGTFDPAGPLGQEVYFDSLTMFAFFLLSGRWLELRLRDRTAGALEALTNRLPDSVERLGRGGEFERVAVRRLVVGDLIRVLPGEAFAADGMVVQGSTLADEALLTGESRPVPRPLGERVIAGSYNLQAPVQVRVECTGPATRFAQIVALMESAALHKPRLAQLADRLAKPFLMAVLSAAVLAGALWWPLDPGHALMVSVAVLIVTCPCALSLATPAAMLAAAGTLARRGVLVRDLQALEALARVDTVVFDKTGTLTREGMVVAAVHCRDGLGADQALAQAAALASHSLHPVSRALVAAQRAGGPGQADWRAEAVEEAPGLGLTGLVSPAASPACARSLRLGSAAFCGARSLSTDALQVHLADEQGWLASFELAEDLRPDAARAVRALQQSGIGLELLSGDQAAAVQRVAAQLGINQAQGGCTPADKLQHMRRAQAQGKAVVMVGDGLNDGPVLAGAQVSFAFGQAVPLAQAQADFVVLGDQLSLIPQTLLLARRTLRVVRQNLAWAAAYNALCVPLAVAGWLPAWAAGLGMALSSLLVVGNAARLSGRLPGLEDR